eukprot:g1839.t1
MLTLTCMRPPLTTASVQSSSAAVGSGREVARVKPKVTLPSAKPDPVNVGHFLRGGCTRLVPQTTKEIVWDEVFTSNEDIELDVNDGNQVTIESPKNPIASNFEMNSELGRGSYGTVYAATDKTTGHEVAIKEVRRIEGCSVLSECKIQQEVDVLDDLKDCNSVVKIHGSYQVDETMYIVTELCKGGDLESYLKTNGTLNEQQIALVMAEALKMLKECHSRKIVHGDIKPANFVIVDRVEYHMFKKGTPLLPNGWLKGIDFGTSQYTGRSRCSNKVGTPTHWAPEVFAGSYHTEADMWSLGVMMYRLMTGRLPFWDNYAESKLKSEKDVLKGVIYKDPDYSGEPWSRVSSDCLDFIKGLLNKNYEKRFSVDAALNHPFMARNLKKTQIFGFGFFDQILMSNNSTTPAPAEAFSAAV